MATVGVQIKEKFNRFYCEIGSSVKSVTSSVIPFFAFLVSVLYLPQYLPPTCVHV